MSQREMINYVVLNWREYCVKLRSWRWVVWLFYPC